MTNNLHTHSCDRCGFQRTGAAVRRDRDARAREKERERAKERARGEKGSDEVSGRPRSSESTSQFPDNARSSGGLHPGPCVVSSFQTDLVSAQTSSTSGDKRHGCATRGGPENLKPPLKVSAARAPAAPTEPTHNFSSLTLSPDTCLGLPGFCRVCFYAQPGRLVVFRAGLL